MIGLGTIACVTDQHSKRRQPYPTDDPASTSSAGQVSEGPSGFADGPEHLGGADAVPDTPDQNFGEDDAAVGGGSSLIPDDAER